MYYFILFVLICTLSADADHEEEKDHVKKMFYHAYNGYLNNAYPYDELRPLTCDGVNTWGSYSLTLVDALDTLAVLGNYSEFRRVAGVLIQSLDFNINLNVSVFETNIRVVGGLLSAHLMSKQAGMLVEPAWPCDGPLLRLSVDLARRLLPAFDTATGMPYGTVNLIHGVDPNETPITCTAGVGTFIIEFATLSRLTGDQSFESVAMRAIRALHNSRSGIGLLGNHIDVSSGKWTALDAGVGAGVDSYFEYLVKGAILLDMPELMKMFKDHLEPINKHLKQGDWYFWANMKSGAITMPIHQSLDAFWPGLQTLYGDNEEAYKTILNYYSVWRKYGGTPEIYSVTHALPFEKREGYPLRPELIESTMYLYRSTKDPSLLAFGRSAVRAIDTVSKTECGYATVKNLHDHTLDNRMESFFLAETIKYLYLLFDPNNPLLTPMKGATLRKFPDGRECLLGGGGYVFNTEAHPIDVSALHCCHTMKRQQEYSEIYSLLRHYNIEDLFKTNHRTRDLNPGPYHEHIPWDENTTFNKTLDKSELSCKAQPFHMKLTKYGQIFVDD